MRISEIVETQSNLQRIMNSIFTEIINQLKDDFEDQQDAHVPIGGNFSQVRSGKVEMVRNFVQGSERYDIFIKIGNAIAAHKPLNVTISYFEEVASEAGAYGVNVNWPDNAAYMHLEANGEKGIVQYGYGSAFCWIGFRLQR